MKWEEHTEEYRKYIPTIKGLVLSLVFIGLFLLSGCDKCPDSGVGETSHWAYCDHMGYERMINETKYNPETRRSHELLCIS